MADYSSMAGYVPGLIAEDPAKKQNMGLLDRIASSVNKAYSDPRRARGLMQMGMSLMDAAGPQQVGQQMSTGQMLARGLAGYQQGADQYEQNAMQQQVAEMKRAQLALNQAKMLREMEQGGNPFVSAFGDSLEGRQLANMAQQYQAQYGVDPQTAINEIVRWKQSQPKTVTTNDAVYNVPVELPFAQGPSPTSQAGEPPRPSPGPTRVIDKQKDIPQGVIDSLSSNMTQLRRIQDAKSLLGKYGDTLGPQNNLPMADLFYQFNKPDATALRGTIAAIENMQIKDVSGATVTAAEDKRLSPYIPKLTDPPGVISQKLDMFERQLQSIIADYSDYYSPENSYRPLPESLRPAPSKAPATNVKRFNPVTGGFE